MEKLRNDNFRTSWTLLPLIFNLDRGKHFGRGTKILTVRYIETCNVCDICVEVQAYFLKRE